jgi:midasin
MDNFPFPFYIVIQQLDGLSETLAEALKQWFELVRNQSSGR